MKLYYIANARIPTEKAHGLQIVKMCQAFAAGGAEVELVAPRRSGRIKVGLFEYYGINRDFKFTKLFCLDLFRFSQVLGNLAFWLGTVSFFISLRIYLLGKGPAVIYSREPYICWFFPTTWLIILELHEIPAKIRPQHIKIWQKAQKIIVITSGIKEKLIKSGIAPEKIFVAADAVDLSEFDLDMSREEARVKASLPPDKKIIMYTGSFYLYDWKGVDVLLRTLPELPADTLLVLVGGQDREIEKIRADYPAENLLLVSSRPHQEIPYYLKSADVLVLPNKSGDAISEFYTSPLKLFEYMASGRPIVSSKLPSLVDVLNKDNSVLVEPNNPQRLIEGIKIVLNDGELASAIAKKAFEDVKKHTWDQRAMEIIEFIGG